MSLNDMYKSLLTGYKLKDITSNSIIPTSITIKLIGKGKYYGWAINGNKQFLLSDFTVVHNCNKKYCSNCRKEIGSNA